MGRRFAAQMGAPLTAQSIEIASLEIRHDRENRDIARQRAPSPIKFDPALSSADVDLVKLADQVARARTTALSFRLSGPPGTGKSAYARYLAERLDLEVLEK